MIIHKKSLLKGAEDAEGLVVIIDVFRAFSLECYLFNQGIEKIYPIGDYKQALEMKKRIKNPLTFGERGGIQLDGFDYGNSPYRIEGIDFRGQTAIHTTSAGTQGLMAARNADTVLTGSFVNAKAICEFIRCQAPKVVTLVAMGSHGLEKTLEDEMCADYIEALLLDQPFMSKETLKESLKEAGKIFSDPEKQASMPQGDFDLCLEMDCFNFVIEVTTNGNDLICTKHVTKS